MPFPANATIYTYTPAGQASISFARILESGDDFVPWLFGEIQYTKDAVLGGSKIYMDIGADVAPPFSVRALVLTPTDRFNLRMARGTTGVLSNTRGRSDTVTLIKASPIDGPGNAYWIDLVFELRPS